MKSCLELSWYSAFMHCGIISLKWQLHGEANSEVLKLRNSQMKLKVYEPISFLFVVVWCWHNSNDIRHLRSDTGVIKTWRLMVFAVAFPIQSLSAAKSSLSDSAHPSHSSTYIIWPTTVSAFGAQDPSSFFRPSRSQTSVGSVSESRQNLVYGHGQEL